MPVLATTWQRRAAWAVASLALAFAGIAACGKSNDNSFVVVEPPPPPLPQLDAALDTGPGFCPSGACLPFHLDCNGDAGDGCEANIRTDINNCGGCGIVCGGDGGVADPPFSRVACIESKCVQLCLDDPKYGPMRNCAGTDPMIADPLTGCPNQLACDGLNCGACRVAAPADPLGDHICISGTPVAACPSGLTNCQGATCGKQCKDLNHDGTNCGACGRLCPDPSIPGATVAALANKHIGFTCGPDPDGGLPNCVPICASSAMPPHLWKDCDGDFDKTVADPTNPAFNGCELDTFHNLSNCGACGNACEGLCHTKPSSDTLEQVCDCPPGLTWCGDACVDTKNDPRHCGSCSGACLGPWEGGNGTPVCLDSQCGYKCNAGFADCNKQLPDGCEVDTQNFPAHCGGCGHRCLPDQRCGNGECQLTECKGPVK